MARPATYMARIDRISEPCKHDKIIDRTSRHLRFAIARCLPHKTGNPAGVRRRDRRHAPDSLPDASRRHSTLWQEAHLVASPDGSARKVDSLRDVPLEVEPERSTLAEDLVFACKGQPRDARPCVRSRVATPSSVTLEPSPDRCAISRASNHAGTPPIFVPMRRTGAPRPGMSELLSWAAHVRRTDSPQNRFGGRPRSRGPLYPNRGQDWPRLILLPSAWRCDRLSGLILWSPETFAEGQGKPANQVTDCANLARTEAYRLGGSQSFIMANMRPETACLAHSRRSQRFSRRSVKPSASPSVVRIHHLPPPAKTAR